MTRPRSPRRCGLTVLAVMTLVLAGCGGADPESSSTTASKSPASNVIGPVVPSGGPTTVDPRVDDKARLTTAQALVLSRMLLKNEQAKGAIAEMFVPFGSAATFTLRGPVDWAGDHGSFVLSTARSDGVRVADSRVIWDRGAVLTEVVGLEKAMEAKGRAGVTFVQRALNPQGVSLDQLVAFVGSLAVDRAENPILLRQGDTAFLGSRTFDGVILDGYRFGKTRYWIDPSSGLLRRVEARFARYDEPVVVTLTGHGPQTISVPPPSAVVDGSSIPDVLATLHSPTP